MGIERTPEPGMLPGLRLRRGLAKNQLFSCRGRPGSIPGSGCEFDLKCEAEWVHGNWMSRQRCAGRRGGKAEFLCGLMGRGWAEALRCRLGVCRIVVEFLDGFCVIFSLVHGMVGISYKIFCLYGHSWSFGF